MWVDRTHVQVQILTQEPMETHLLGFHHYIHNIQNTTISKIHDWSIWNHFFPVKLVCLLFWSFTNMSWFGSWWIKERLGKIAVMLLYCCYLKKRPQRAQNASLWKSQFVVLDLWIKYLLKLSVIELDITVFEAAYTLESKLFQN